MDRKNFGKLIVALRREHLDWNLTPWTRQRFADESGIDEEILTNIEIGRRAILYPDLLFKMADALKLTNGERKEFFLAASGVDEQSIYQQHDNPKTALEDMLAVMDQLQQPAILVDQFFDVIAINLLVMELYGISGKSFLTPSANPLTRYNLIRLLFSSEFNEQKAMFGKSWDKFAANMVAVFRAISLRYRATDYFQRMAQQLYEFEDFKNLLQRQRKAKDEYYMDSNVRIQFENPKFGSVNCVSTTITSVSSTGEIYLLVFTPLNEETVQIFSHIAEQGNYLYQPLPNWPLKNEIEENLK